MFPNHSSLAQSRWGNYFTAVYGSLPNASSAYPFCVGDFWMFYDKLLETYNVTDIPSVVGICPTEGGKVNGQRYSAKANAYWPPTTSWSWHATNTSNVLQPRK